mgnify:CR=1 FL=1
MRWNTMSKFTVIGGGIAGASTAYHLAKSGHDVTVYDRFDEGQATRASAGIICPWTSQRRNKKWYRLVQAGAQYYPSFIKDIEALTGLDTGYDNHGALCLFKDDRIQQLAFERILKKKEFAPEMGEVKKLSAAELLEIHPSLTSSYPAVFVEGGAQINGQQLLNALKQGYLHYGGKWIQANLEPEEGEGVVIYAAGAWGKEFVAEPMIQHQKAELLHVEVKAAIQASTPVVMGLGPTYIVPTGKNKYAIGTTHEDTASFDISPSKKSEQYLLQEAKRYFPNTPLEVSHMSVGLRPFTRDSLPYLGWSKKNIFIINGLGSSGLTSGPVIGREVAAYLTNQTTKLPMEDYAYS